MRRSLLGVLVTLILLPGCGSDQEREMAADHDRGPAIPTERQNEGGRRPGHEPPPAVPRKVIGGVGESSTGCEIPVRFMMTGKWDPRPVTATPPDERAGHELICEIDAPSKPGVLRIWIGDDTGSDPRAALEAFLADGADSADGAGRDGARRDGAGPRTPRYSKLVADDVSGWQAGYPRTVGDGDREAAFALPVGGGVLVVSMGPLPSKKYAELLPVYVLAKTTIKVTS